MINCSSPQMPTSHELRRERRRQSPMAAKSPREEGHMRRRRDTGAASFVGSGSGIHFVRTVRQAFARNSRMQSLNHEAIDDELVPGEDDRLYQQSLPDLLWHGDEVLFPDQGQEDLLPNPTFDDMVRWTKPYFLSWHPTFPFLHAPTVLLLLEKMSIRTFSGLELTDRIIIRSVMSISAADRRQALPEEGILVPANLLYQSIKEALSTIQPLLIHPPSLPALQAAVSIQIFLISMLRLNAASRVGGLIVRMSYHLGLHRCPSRFPLFSSTEVDIRRRLFWTIYCIERYLSQALGLPLELKDDDLDVCFPDQELHTSSNASDPNLLPSLESQRLMLPTALARHGRIKGLILELRNKSVLHRTTSHDEVAHIDAEISKWWNDTQELLNPLPVDGPTMWRSQIQEEVYAAGNVPPYSLKASHKLLLLVQKHESVILLNRPVITSGYNTSAHAPALQNCIGASKAIISNIYRHINDGMKAEGAQNGRIHDPLVWPGFVWMIWQSGLILLYAAFEGHYSVQTAHREANCCVAILQNLALRGNFWPNACGAAIQELQTSLDAKTMGEAVPGQITTGTYPPITSRRSTVSRETVVDGSNSDGASTDQYKAALSLEDLETRPQASPRGNESENNSNQYTDEAMAFSHVSHNSRQLDPHIVGIPYPIGLESQAELTSKQRTETSANAAYLARQNIGIWPLMNNLFNNAGDALNGFDDIFQLVDMSHILNDQFSQPQPGVYDMGWHRSDQL